MAIITISRGSFSHGKEIAESVAERLEYECISREILIEASQLFNISETKLIQSIHDAPSTLERITRGKEKYLAYIQAALLQRIKNDNIVYHGHAGHLLLAAIPRVLKVRVIADQAERVALMQRKENISKEEAKTAIKNEDKHRAQWTRYLYKTDLNDPWLYDIIINIGQLNVSDACEIICTAARSEAYKTNFDSKKAISDMAIVSHIKAALQDICEADVSSNNGHVHIKVAAQKIRKTGQASPALQLHIFSTIKGDLTRQVSEIAREIPGVTEVVCEVGLPYY
jgi:cytidylate kinase